MPETEIDRSVSVIEIQQEGSLYKSWVDSLELVPSVDLRQRAPNDVQGDFSIRGSSFGQTLVLVNGLRMDDVQSSHHDMDLPLPSDSVERIEVLRGAGSTLYGSDAMAGSVNVITSGAETLGCARGSRYREFWRQSAERISGAGMEKARLAARRRTRFFQRLPP
jgi:iron complex outermembrane receptor protein